MFVCELDGLWWRRQGKRRHTFIYNDKIPFPSCEALAAALRVVFIHRSNDQRLNPKDVSLGGVTPSTAASLTSRQRSDSVGLNRLTPPVGWRLPRIRLPGRCWTDLINNGGDGLSPAGFWMSNHAPEQSMLTIRRSRLDPPTSLDAVRAGGGRHPTNWD